MAQKPLAIRGKHKCSLAIGVHEVDADEPVHLIEVCLGQEEAALDWTSVTQPGDNPDRSYWQAAYDERQVPGSSDHWCFFFHYLDLSKPLQTNLGPLRLPPVSPMPAHLRIIQYEEP
ncbi:MAG: hypothetical protein WBO04_02400 [Steroidobacteraceae bacterium]